MNPRIDAPSPRIPRGGTTAFFRLTFALTWVLQVPAVLAAQGLLPGAPTSYLPLAALGIFGPLVAATYLTARAEGRSGLRRLYARLLPSQVRWHWYAVALLLPAVLLAAVLQLLNLAGRTGDVVFNRGAAALVVAVFISVAEEVGWRGYALPRLMAKLGAFAGSGVLGVVWMVWHIPMFVGLGIPLSLLLVMLLFFLGGSLTFTWLYNRTGGSLFIAVLAHLGVHMNNSHAALPGKHLPLVVHAVVFAGLGLGAALLDARAFPELHSWRAHLSRQRAAAALDRSR